MSAHISQDHRLYLKHVLTSIKPTNPHTHKLILQFRKNAPPFHREIITHSICEIYKKKTLDKDIIVYVRIACYDGCWIFTASIRRAPAKKIQNRSLPHMKMVMCA